MKVRLNLAKANLSIDAALNQPSNLEVSLNGGTTALVAVVPPGELLAALGQIKKAVDSAIASCTGEAI